MYRQASRKSRDESIMGTARTSTPRPRTRRGTRVGTNASSGCCRKPASPRPALHRRPHPADLRPRLSGAFDFSQMAMPADRPIAVLPGSAPAPPWSSISTPCCPWTPASARRRWRNGPTTSWRDRILDIKILDPAMGSGAFLVEVWHAHGGPPAIPPGEGELLHARRLFYPFGHNPSAIYSSGCIRGTLLPPTHQLHESAIAA